MRRFFIVAAAVGRRRAYAALDLSPPISIGFVRVHLNCSTKAVLRAFAYGNDVLRIGLAAPRGSGNFGLCTRRRRAQVGVYRRKRQVERLQR
jgi:hypothetical protein